MKRFLCMMLGAFMLLSSLTGCTVMPEQPQPDVPPTQQDTQPAEPSRDEPIPTKPEPLLDPDMRSDVEPEVKPEPEPKTPVNVSEGEEWLIQHWDMDRDLCVQKATARGYKSIVSWMNSEEYGKPIVEGKCWSLLEACERMESFSVALDGRDFADEADRQTIADQFAQVLLETLMGDVEAWSFQLIDYQDVRSAIEFREKDVESFIDRDMWVCSVYADMRWNGIIEPLGEFRDTFWGFQEFIYSFEVTVEGDTCVFRPNWHEICP